VPQNDGDRSSFNAAAKHLFRHLHDAASLRKNPLVRRFFFSGDANERLTLARIHEMVKKGAERCRDADLLDGRERQASQQYAIIMQQCLGRRPISAVAAKLGISFKHCYRQRAEICRRVAQYVSQCDDDGHVEYTPDVDAFRIALDQAGHHCALADVRNSLQLCEDLLHDASSATQAIEALRVGAMAAMRFGDVQGVNGYYATARRVYAENLSDPSFGSVVARACIDLIESKLAYYSANTTEALASAERAAQGLQSAWQSAPERIRELYVESLYEAASAFCIAGDLDRSHEYLVEAEAHCKRLTVSSARLRAKIALGGWKLRACSLLSSATFRPASQRHRGLLSAFELAYSAGLLHEATAAMTSLAEHHALSGNDSEALRACRLALALAVRQPSEPERAQTSIVLAVILCTTRYWAFGLSLLPSAAALERCGELHRMLARHVVAKRALRSRQFEDAWTLATNENDDDFTALAVGQRIVAAQAAHGLGRRNDAHALVESIVPAAEQLSDAAVLRDAYGIAACVTGETRFRRQARELSKLLVE
jgi:hypothetical protein